MLEQQENLEKVLKQVTIDLASTNFSPHFIGRKAPFLLLPTSRSWQNSLFCAAAGVGAAACADSDHASLASGGQWALAVPAASAASARTPVRDYVNWQ